MQSNRHRENETRAHSQTHAHTHTPFTAQMCNVRTRGFLRLLIGELGNAPLHRGRYTVRWTVPYNLMLWTKFKEHLIIIKHLIESFRSARNIIHLKRHPQPPISVRNIDIDTAIIPARVKRQTRRGPDVQETCWLIRTNPVLLARFERGPCRRRRLLLDIVLLLRSFRTVTGAHLGWYAKSHK